MLHVHPSFHMNGPMLHLCWYWMHLIACYIVITTERTLQHVTSLLLLNAPCSTLHRYYYWTHLAACCIVITTERTLQHVTSILVLTHLLASYIVIGTERISQHITSLTILNTPYCMLHLWFFIHNNFIHKLVKRIGQQAKSLFKQYLFVQTLHTCSCWYWTHLTTHYIFVGS
jgi:hypothetical protein